MGSWQGTGFRQTISGIEDLRGTREFGDKLSGSDGAESFYGRGGDDAIFGDGFDPTYAMDEAASVYRLYQATLDRAPDLRGLTNWSERLFTGESGLQQVATGFVNSAEFQATYGALDDAGFVELLYQNVLGRAADAGVSRRGGRSGPRHRDRAVRPAPRTWSADESRDAAHRAPSPGSRY
ncbi:MAG: hypothetical protein CME82_13790 [Halomonas sp.]|nr:hypothetical protein [Halomonas sp.]